MNVPDADAVLMTEPLTSSPVPSGAPPRSLTTTFAPSLENSSACSRPMPRPAPVMTAIRPSSAPIAHLRKSVLDHHVACVRRRLVRVRAVTGVPDPGRDRLLRLNRLREAHRQPLQALGVVRAGVLDQR